MTIVIGRCVDQVGGALQVRAAAAAWRTGRSFDARTIAMIFPPDKISRVIAAPGIVDRDHDHQPIGRIEHAELDASGVWLVAELRDAAPVTERHAFSIEAVHDGDPRDGWQLRRVAITRTPAMHSIGKLTVIHAATLRDLHPTTDPKLRARGQHHLAALLGRAVEAQRRRRTGDPIAVTERRDPTAVMHLDGGLVLDARTMEPLGVVHRTGTPVPPPRTPPSARGDEPVGPIEIRPCRITSVR